MISFQRQRKLVIVKGPLCRCKRLRYLPLGFCCESSGIWPGNLCFFPSIRPCEHIQCQKQTLCLFECCHHHLLFRECLLTSLWPTSACNGCTALLPLSEAVCSVSLVQNVVAVEVQRSIRLNTGNRERFCYTQGSNHTHSWWTKK